MNYNASYTYDFDSKSSEISNETHPLATTDLDVCNISRLLRNACEHRAFASDLMIADRIYRYNQPVLSKKKKASSSPAYFCLSFTFPLAV